MTLVQLLQKHFEINKKCWFVQQRVRVLENGEVQIWEAVKLEALEGGQNGAKVDEANIREAFA